MYRYRMWLSIAVLCLMAVCIFVAGCQCTTTCSARKLGPYGFKTSRMGEEGFIINWLVVGPFPNPGGRPDNEGFHIDYLKKYGGEANYVPANGMEIIKDDDTKLKWAQYESSYTDIDFFSIDHLGLNYSDGNILTYSACWLKCKKDMDVEIRVGSDDGYKLWIDHKLIAEQRVYRYAEMDSEIYPIKLSKGIHLILIKVDDDAGDYSFIMRVVTPNGKKVPGLKVWN